MPLRGYVYNLLQSQNLGRLGSLAHTEQGIITERKGFMTPKVCDKSPTGSHSSEGRGGSELRFSHGHR